MSSIARRGFVHHGMDVSNHLIDTGVLPQDRDVDGVFHDAEPVRRLIASGQLGVQLRIAQGEHCFFVRPDIGIPGESALSNKA